MSERTMAMGEAAELRQQLMALAMEMGEVRQSIRVLLMPHVEPEAFELEKFTALASRLVAMADEYRDGNRKLQALRADYGLK